MSFESARLVAAALYVAVLLFGGGRVHSQMHWIVLGFILLIAGLRLVEKLWNAILVRREIIAFRSLDAEQREAFLDALWPRGLRSEYTRHVDMDEAHDIDGTTERFAFPKAERRLHWHLFWSAAGLAILLLLAGTIVPGLPAPIRIACVLVAALAALPAAWLTGRLALLSSRLEVTPFNVALIWPAGRRAVISLNQPLVLVNEPTKGFTELRAAEGSGSLHIHHARLASTRAIDLIWDRGGFEALTTDKEGAT